MSLKSQIETAKDAVSTALITALKNKDESSVTKLITCYNTLTDIKITEPFNFSLYNVPCSMNDDVISFS